MARKKNISKKVGRNEEINPEELLKRYAALKRFLEDNWGRLGLKLPRARKPEAVLAVLNLVPNAKWHPAFRDFPPGCLLRPNAEKSEWRELRATREECRLAELAEQRLFPESYKANQAAQGAVTALNAAKAEFGKSESRGNDRRLHQITEQLRVEELTNLSTQLAQSLRHAQECRQKLQDHRDSEEAWIARTEVVEFCRDAAHRYAKTPSHFAKAMAGLPYYDWLYSVRKCLSITGIDKISSTPWFQLFEFLTKIVRRTKSANIKIIESKLKAKLLREDSDPLLLSYISPQWFYVTLAFDDCRGKKIRPGHLPYKVMEKFLDHYEGPSVAEAELAKHNQLLASLDEQL
jgi:hypothetical protein